jgi:endonuclease YncB( thermonuclease family)
MFRFVRLSAVIGILFFAFVSFWPAVKKDHAGPAKVIDAVTLSVNGETHRLYGVMAPQQRGAEATAALAKFLEGRKVTCQVWQGKTHDAEGRFISVCYAGSDDIAAWAARNGWAIADHDANRLYNYTSDEGMARFLGKGVWAGVRQKY